MSDMSLDGDVRAASGRWRESAGAEYVPAGEDSRVMAEGNQQRQPGHGTVMITTAPGQDPQATDTCGQDARATRGQDARTTHGQDARATRGRDARDTHGRDAHATHGQDARATPGHRPRPPKLYRIGEVVSYSGMSRQTIHNYTTMGLLHESRWTQGGHRLYDEDVFERLDKIADLKAGNKTMQDIRDYFAELDRREPVAT